MIKEIWLILEADQNKTSSRFTPVLSDSPVSLPCLNEAPVCCVFHTLLSSYFVGLDLVASYPDVTALSNNWAFPIAANHGLPPTTVAGLQTTVPLQGTRGASASLY